MIELLVLTIGLAAIFFIACALAWLDAREREGQFDAQGKERVGITPRRYGRSR